MRPEAILELEARLPNLDETGTIPTRTPECLAIVGQESGKNMPGNRRYSQDIPKIASRWRAMLKELLLGRRSRRAKTVSHAFSRYVSA